MSSEDYIAKDITQMQYNRIRVVDTLQSGDAKPLARFWKAANNHSGYVRGFHIQGEDGNHVGYVNSEGVHQGFLRFGDPLKGIILNPDGEMLIGVKLAEDSRSPKRTLDKRLS